jgi:DNA-binding response OmpR family regulator
MKVLVIDDDPATLDVLEFALTLEGHQVLRALDGSEGLARLEAERPDVVIVDSMMPVMDGIAFTRTLREDAALRHTPVLMLTAKVMATDVWAGWQAGVDSYITKPLDFEVLQAEIDRVAGAAA